jgi:8-oxo-dGTP diphosphatase
VRRSYVYEYPRPAVTVDCALFAMRPADLAVLLVQRKHAPFRGAWALPGGFVNENEPLERAAARELAEETGIRGVPLEPLGAFGEPGRDPRGHTVSAVFLSFLVADVQPVAADDAADAAWMSLGTLPLPSRGEPARSKRGVRIAFDHALIIDAARRRLAEHLVDPARQAPFGIVPPRFTLNELRRVYESVLGKTLDPRRFRARVLARGLAVPVARARGKGRSELFRFGDPWPV